MHYRSKLFWLYIAITVAYVTTFLMPRTISNLPSLPNGQQRLVGLAVVIPLAIIWFLAFYGSATLHSYAKKIHDSEDGKQVAFLATGLLIVALGLPIGSMGTAIGNIVSTHNQEAAIVIRIVRNYVSMLFPLVGFLFINHAAYGLSRIARHRPRYRDSQVLIAVYVIVSTAYCYAALSSPNIEAIYHLPPWLLMLTLVAPYLFTWYTGLLAAYEVRLYAKNVAGKLYRQSWNILSLGLAAIVTAQILLQYSVTFTVRIQSLQMVRLFVTIYILLAAMSVGYVLVAAGAKQLKKIEEV